MKAFSCTDHAGHWPVGVASVVIAPNEDEARVLLSCALADRHLDPDPASFTLTEIDLDAPAAHVLNDGDY